MDGTEEIGFKIMKFSWTRLYVLVVVDGEALRSLCYYLQILSEGLAQPQKPTCGMPRAKRWAWFIEANVTSASSMLNWGVAELAKSFGG